MNFQGLAPAKPTELLPQSPPLQSQGALGQIKVGQAFRRQSEGLHKNAAVKTKQKAVEKIFSWSLFTQAGEQSREERKGGKDKVE